MGYYYLRLNTTFKFGKWVIFLTLIFPNASILPVFLGQGLYFSRPWCVTASLQEDDCGAQEGDLTGDFSGTPEEQKGHPQCALHTHTWLDQLNPDGVPAAFGGIVLLDGVSTKMGFVSRPGLCGESISCPTHEVSQWAVHTWAHTASFPSHAHKLCGKLFSELWHILMSLGSFLWGLTTAILSERFSTKLRDNFH